MGDSSLKSGLSKNAEKMQVSSGEKVYKSRLFASGPKSFSKTTYGHITSLSDGKMRSRAVGNVALFLLKVAALETVRRVSRAKCPIVWNSLQALQVLSYPPFKWIQRWAPFKGLVKGSQILSKPMLFLSIATAFYNEVGSDDETSDGGSDNTCSEVHPEPSPIQSTLDTRIPDEAPQGLPSEIWLIELYKELGKQGISLPERMNGDELHRFYTAANGNFASLLTSIKKTIRWRETYRILSGPELDVWSNMVFWHGFDMKHRPCLIVRLGLACFSLRSHDRPSFVQAVVSQVEYGILHLVDAETGQIVVVADCEGLSPMKFPMQMMRSCSSLLQDHFPNRLGCLFVIRLPPVVRVIAQTFIQVLKPVTRQKLKIQGEMYQKVLSDYLDSVPLYLGGNCACTKCSKTVFRDTQHPRANETNRIEPITGGSEVANLPSPNYDNENDIFPNVYCDQILRTAIIGILMVWVLIALIAGLYDSESSSLGAS